VKEDFPSLKELWENRRNPEMMAKLMAFFAGMNAFLILWGLLIFNRHDDVLIYAIRIVYGIFTLLEAYLLFLGRGDRGWRIFLWFVPFKAILFLAIFSIK